MGCFRLDAAVQYWHLYDSSVQDWSLNCSCPPDWCGLRIGRSKCADERSLCPEVRHGSMAVHTDCKLAKRPKVLCQEFGKVLTAQDGTSRSDASQVNQYIPIALGSAFRRGMNWLIPCPAPELNS